MVFSQRQIEELASEYIDEPSEEVRRTQVGPGLEREQKRIAIPPILSSGIERAIVEMARFEANDFTDRVQTGIKKLDRRLRGGLKGGQLTLLGAPSGGGKTSVAMQIAVDAAKKGPVLFVSPEMGISELAEREIIR